MKIEKSIPHRCNFCEQLAEQFLQTNNFLFRKLYICISCKKKLFEILSKQITPKSPEAPYSPKRLIKY